MFKGGLGYDLAQKIVDNIMKIVSYNINIMDKQGTIIASGNPQRINKQHLGAIRALEEQQPYYIYEDTELEKKGINVPFFYKDEIVGVIGVSGEPHKVEEIAHIVRVTAELMIEKQFYDNKAFAYETRARDLFNEIIAKPKQHLEPHVIDRAKDLTIDLNIERIVAIVSFNFSEHDWLDHFKSQLCKGEYIIKENKQDATIVFIYSTSLMNRLDTIMKTSPCVGVIYLGYPSKDLHASYLSALSMVDIAYKLNLKKTILKIEDYIIEDTAFKIDDLEYYKDVYHRFAQVSNFLELQDTLFTYIKHGFDKNLTCEALYIHKNTLYYRIQKMSEITGFDINNPKDVLILYMILLKNSYQHLNIV
jgi:carbohydrate diacid regulator